jgi:hypothetical protein
MTDFLDRFHARLAEPTPVVPVRDALPANRCPRCSGCHREGTKALEVCAANPDRRRLRRLRLRQREVGDLMITKTTMTAKDLVVGQTVINISPNGKKIHTEPTCSISSRSWHQDSHLQITFNEVWAEALAAGRVHFCTRCC